MHSRTCSLALAVVLLALCSGCGGLEARLAGTWEGGLDKPLDPDKPHLFSTLLAPEMTLQLDPDQRFVMTGADNELRGTWSVFKGEVRLAPKQHLVWIFYVSADEASLYDSPDNNPVSFHKVPDAADAQ